MKDYLISQYIDNELDLDEKITFVETVNEDRHFTDEAVALLRQEKQLRTELAFPLPALPQLHRAVRTPPLNWLALWFKPLAGFAAGAVVVILLALFRPGVPPVPQGEPHRFVVYLPENTQARILGTFTNWQPVPMEPVGSSGYWTLTLRVPEGEHRYSYLVEEDRLIADPTVMTREQDDFGGENSVIEVRGLAI
ncbi:MAG: hypothetical protein JZU50_03095 [Desulfobulbaceae bacterium]|nr:hypothetical protein [Desulfobulbaceae bacterium]